MKRIQGIAAAALAASLMASATAAYADVLILRSVGPSANRYKAGQRLPDDARLVLRPGDSVSVLRSGGTRVFRGPGTYNLDAAAVQATSTARGGRIIAGVVRGADGSVVDGSLPADLWQVDASTGGTACFVAGAPVVLWRRQAESRGSVAVTTRAGATTRLTWPARQATLRIPARAAADGSRISYGITGSSRQTQILLAELKVDPRNRDAVGQALVSRNCLNQIEYFIALNEEGAS
jgi:hypothetical protein